MAEFSLPALLRRSIILGYDVVAGVIAFGAALMLRFGSWPPPESADLMFYALPYGLLAGFLGWRFHLTHQVMRYFGRNDVLKIIQVVGLCILLTSVTIFLFSRLENYPRSALIMLFLLHLTLLAGPRVLLRLWHDRPQAEAAFNGQTKTAILIGAGDRADRFMRTLLKQKKPPYRILQLFDDDPNKIERELHGLPIKGPLTKLPSFLKDMPEIPQLAILTASSLTRRQDVLTSLRQQGCNIVQVPEVTELASADGIQNLKPVLIEDLLGRPSRQLNLSIISDVVTDNVVLITGAGGSIGSEMARQLSGLKPSALILLDHSEFNLYQIEQELKEIAPELTLHSVMADVRDAAMLDTIIKTYQPRFICHAAAYKHVPLVEANPIAGISVNVLGTANLLKVAADNNVGTVMMISTDKAVNPTNVMGATKRAAELVMQTYQDQLQTIAVRFGNVLGSSGSVIPHFQKQIRQGGPVTVTHQQAERYFMTINEAVALTLRATALGISDQSQGQVYMLDMGDPVRIWDLAESMIKLSGLVPGDDIEVKEIGLRPGEKLKEELRYDAELMTKTSVPEIYQVTSTANASTQKLLKKLSKACATGDQAAAIKVLKELVPEYQPAMNSPYRTAA